jgi:hypothetical protein
MIECIFTLDYEIYGNGVGSLRELVLYPTERLAEIFAEFSAPFVVFAEAVEFAKIEEAGSDPDAAAVRTQLRGLRAAGHEIALHLHPWWANARYENGHWQLDWTERNLGALSPDRIDAIVCDAIQYLRGALDDPEFTPVSFRSGLWAMQPTRHIASVLARHGIQADSSVFRGGRITSLDLDYRSVPANQCTWHFKGEVTTADPAGALWEFPIHSELVPFWQMLGSRRLRLHRKAQSPGYGKPLPRRWRDYLRFRYPRKLDFCRMTFEEMRSAVQNLLDREQLHPATPIVAIGHSKDFDDADTVWRFLTFLQERHISLTTFSHTLCREMQLSC